MPNVHEILAHTWRGSWRCPSPWTRRLRRPDGRAQWELEWRLSRLPAGSDLSKVRNTSSEFIKWAASKSNQQYQQRECIDECQPEDAKALHGWHGAAAWLAQPGAGCKWDNRRTRRRICQTTTRRCPNGSHFASPISQSSKSVSEPSKSSTQPKSESKSLKLTKYGMI